MCQALCERHEKNAEFPLWRPETKKGENHFCQMKEDCDGERERGRWAGVLSLFSPDPSFGREVGSLRVKESNEIISDRTCHIAEPLGIQNHLFRAQF